MEERLKDKPEKKENRFEKLKPVKWFKEKSFKKKAFLVGLGVFLIVALLVAAVVLIMIFSNKTDSNNNQAQTVLVTSSTASNSYSTSTVESTRTPLLTTCK